MPGPRRVGRATRGPGPGRRPGRRCGRPRGRCAAGWCRGRRWAAGSPGTSRPCRSSSAEAAMAALSCPMITARTGVGWPGRNRSTWARSRPRRASPSAEVTTPTAASAAAESAGLRAVVKIWVRARLTSRSTRLRGPATNPPRAPRVFESVPTWITIGPRDAGLRHRHRLEHRVGLVDHEHGVVAGAQLEQVLVRARRRRPSRTPSRRPRPGEPLRGPPARRRGRRGRGGGAPSARPRSPVPCGSRRRSTRGSARRSGCARPAARGWRAGPGWRRSRWGTPRRPRCPASRRGRPRGRGARVGIPRRDGWRRHRCPTDRRRRWPPPSPPGAGTARGSRSRRTRRRPGRWR